MLNIVIISLAYTIKKYYCRYIWWALTGEIGDAFGNPMTELYLMFYQYTNPLFEKNNHLLQSGAPQIHVLHMTYYQLYNDLLQSFLSPQCLGEFEDVSDVVLDPNTIEYVTGMQLHFAFSLLL